MQLKNFDRWREEAIIVDCNVRKEDGENPNKEFIPFIAKNVLVSGKVFEVGGMKAIIPSAVKEWRRTP